MINLALRPYQEECKERIFSNFRDGVSRQLISLPTGAGKTVVFAHIIQQMQRKSLVLAHTCELLEQARDKIKMICPDLSVGIVNAFSKEFNHTVVISSIQSARQPDTLTELQKQGFTLCVADECHHFAADSPRLILETLGFLDNPEKILVGFSATPFRQDGRGLGELFEKIVYEKTIKNMISQGYLCQPRGIKVAIDLDLSQTSIDDGDYSASSLSKVMDTEQINRLVVDTYLDKGERRKTICFATTVSHAQHLAGEFQKRLIPTETIYGNMPTKQRKEILDRFKNGDTRVLTNCQVLTEGFDCPEVDCVIVARPTKSPGLYQQMVGRGLRLFPNKSDCLVIDFSDTHHSLCNVAILVGDAETVEHKECRNNTKMVSLSCSLPPKINPKLRSAIREYDLLGDNFTWLKDGVAGYTLKGCENSCLKIFTTAEGKFSVIFYGGNSPKTIARDLNFEYAFAAAEGFAKENRSHFIVSDLDAPWRSLPISDKQKDVFRSFGYRSGIDNLSRGQAALIISSGVLSRKAARR